MVYFAIMTRYEAPKGEDLLYQCKFLRVGDDLFVTEPDNLDTRHDALAMQDGVSDQVKAFQRSEPDSLDAGVLKVSTAYGEHKLSICGESSRLCVYETPVVRQKTMEVFETQSPGFTIEKGSI